MKIPYPTDPQEMLDKIKQRCANQRKAFGPKASLVAEIDPDDDDGWAAAACILTHLTWVVENCDLTLKPGAQVRPYVE